LEQIKFGRCWEKVKSKKAKGKSKKLRIYFRLVKNLINIFDVQFQTIHARSCEIIKKIPLEKIYWQPLEIKKDFPINSVGEYILRSSGIVEQTFGGITTRLWDDPFEWTLPEALHNNQLILQYLEEVEATRKKGFMLFQSDADLQKEIPAPIKIKPIFQILLETISVSENYQGRATAIFQLVLHDN
jgi:hypothetical protein